MGYPKNASDFNKQIEYYQTIPPDSELTKKFW